MQVEVDKNIVVHEEENGIILVNMNKDKTYALDYVGSLIFRKIRELGNLQAVVDQISEEAFVDKKLIEDDIEEFVFKLKDADVIKVYSYH